MAKNASSFRPGTSGNPSGRPKGIRTLARLIDSVGDEPCSGAADTGENYRTTTIRRLWEAAATGRLNLGKSSGQLKAEEWIELVQWLVKHVDNAAVAQWDWQGNMQAQVDAGVDVEQVVREAEAARTRRLTADSDDAGKSEWVRFVEAALAEADAEANEG